MCLDTLHFSTHTVVQTDWIVTSLNLCIPFQHAHYGANDSTLAFTKCWICALHFNTHTVVQTDWTVTSLNLCIPFQHAHCGANDSTLAFTKCWICALHFSTHTVVQTDWTVTSLNLCIPFPHTHCCANRLNALIIPCSCIQCCSNRYNTSNDNLYVVCSKCWFDLHLISISNHSPMSIARCGTLGTLSTSTLGMENS